MKKYVYEDSRGAVMVGDHLNLAGGTVEITSVDVSRGLKGRMRWPVGNTAEAILPLTPLGITIVEVPNDDESTFADLVARLDREQGAVAETMRLINERLKERT